MSFKGKKEKKKNAEKAAKVAETEKTEKAAVKNKEGFEVMPDPPKKRYEMDPKIIYKEKDLAKLEDAISASTGPLGTLIFPFQVYVFFLMFNHPAGWFLMNLIIPLKAHYEYS